MSLPKLTNKVQAFSIGSSRGSFQLRFRGLAGARSRENAATVGGLRRRMRPGFSQRENHHRSDTSTLGGVTGGGRSERAQLDAAPLVPNEQNTNSRG